MHKISNPENEYIVHENVILIEADSPEQADEIATRQARDEATIEDQLTIDGEAAVKRFIGVRKVIAIRNPGPIDLDQERPVSGTEITYNVLFVKGEENLNRLAIGDEVSLDYLE